MDKTQNILITGASGLIGTRLTQLLIEKGYAVSHLGREKKAGAIKSFVWDIEKSTIEEGALANTSTIIHLAGAGVADKRWTEKRKQEILDSRIKSTALLHKELQKKTHHVTSFISASAIGYYGMHDSNEMLTESSKPGTDYLARVTKQWEDEVDRISELNIRLVKLRIGIVLSEKGGALKEIIKPIRLYAGAPLGSGEQQQSWIHIDDLCGMFIKAVEDEHMHGAYNAVGPYPVSNTTLTKTIASVVKKPLLLPHVPAFVLKLMLGEMADVVLRGNKVSSRKIQDAGYKLKFNDLETALKDLLV